MIAFGAENLSDSELLAILLRTGGKGISALEIAQKLILENKNIAGLVNKSIEDLTKVKGIGKDKAITLKAAFEIAKRLQVQSKWLSETKITEPRLLADLVIPLLRDEPNEKFYVACLNSANKLIALKKISEGTLNTTIVTVRDVFKKAIETDASSIILVHNHPSGNASPSNADIKLTQKIKSAGEIFSIQLLDHLIVAGNNYFSFVEKKLL